MSLLVQGPVLKAFSSALRTGEDRGEVDVRLVCVVASLLFFGCEPTPVDRPTILVFSMPGCGDCVEQRLTQLECDGYSILRINVSSQPELRLVSVPLYLVIRRERIILRTNNLDLVIRTVQDGRSIQK